MLLKEPIKHHMPPPQPIIFLIFFLKFLWTSPCSWMTSNLKMSHSGGKLKSLMVISFLKFGSHGFLSASSSPLIRRRQPESTQISQKRRRPLLTHFPRHGGIVSLFIHLKIVALSQRRAAGSVSWVKLKKAHQLRYSGQM